MGLWQFFRRRIWAARVPETVAMSQPQDPRAWPSPSARSCPTGNTELNPITGAVQPKSSEA